MSPIARSQKQSFKSNLHMCTEKHKLKYIPCSKYQNFRVDVFVVNRIHCYDKLIFGQLMSHAGKI